MISHAESETTELTEMGDRLVVARGGGGAKWVRAAKRHKLPIIKARFVLCIQILKNLVV